MWGLHYLNSSGDKSQDITRFWLDTRANLRREMEDRKRRFDDKTEVRGTLAEAVKKGIGPATFVDVKEGRLTIDTLQQRQAEKELKSVQELMPRVARECYRWLLCPVQETPTDPKPKVEAFALNTSSGSLCSDPNASVRVVLEISAAFPEGVSDSVKRAVSENANSLGLKSADWE